MELVGDILTIALQAFVNFCRWVNKKLKKP